MGYIQRKGSTAKDYRRQDASPHLFEVPAERSICIGLDIGASGGTSDVIVTFTNDQFESIALSMIRADREAAIKAFGSALFYDRADPYRLPSWIPLFLRKRLERN
jgi:hypothetical protein